jgi:hypothetical protein
LPSKYRASDRLSKKSLISKNCNEFLRGQKRAGDIKKQSEEGEGLPKVMMGRHPEMHAVLEEKEQSSKEGKVYVKQVDL